MTQRPGIKNFHDGKLKCCVVGDDTVGKTSMLMTYAGREIQDCHVTVFDHHFVNIKVDEKQIEAELLDTGCQCDYDRLRPLSYPDTDVFLLCYSIDDRHSFENIKIKWIPEIMQHTLIDPFLLVGTKADLRNKKEKPQNLIPKEEGTEMAKDVGAVKYIECSAITKEGLGKLFEEAGRAVLSAREKKITKKTKKKDCCIL